MPSSSSTERRTIIDARPLPHPLPHHLAAFGDAHRQRGEEIIKAADAEWAALRTPPPPPSGA
jgi:hypothetical protein